MVYKTSAEAHDEYVRLREIEERCERNNKGISLINPGALKPKEYYIKVHLIATQNLVSVNKRIQIETNIPCAYSYGEKTRPSFLKDLKKWVLTPKYTLWHCWNRKRENQANTWNSPSFRETDISFGSIVFDIGTEAKNTMNIKRFKSKVQKLLLLQRDATPSEIIDFERYSLLCQYILDISRQTIKDNSYRYYEKPDDTLRIVFSKEEYNTQLKEIETELKKLCSKHEVLTMPSIYYKEIPDVLSFEDFKEEEEENLLESWNTLNDEEKAEYDSDLDVFLERTYEETVD